MTNNLRHWNALSKTDPRHTKPFQRAGGFRGTATRPIWVEMRLTEHFGPCGIGWGCDEPAFSIVPAGDEILVFCTLACWYMDDGKRATVYGIGGDKILVKQQSGLRADDEAYKKAFTDALGNAFKHVGSGADVHMGLFEDSKYKAEVAAEFAEDGHGETASARSPAPPSQPPNPPTPSQAPTSGQILPPSPEEPPEVAQRRRIKSLIYKTDAAIKAARNSIALNTMWSAPQTMLDLEEIENAGEAGKDAAYKLRSRFMARADQLADSESRAA